MYCIGDVVLYTTYGICRIKDIIKRVFNGNENSYYVLIPITEAKTELTIPVDNPMTLSRLHPLLPSDEIEKIIEAVPYLEVYWIENENQRKKDFGDIIKNGNRLETLKMIKSIKAHKLSLKDKSRKLHACDEQYMREGQKLIVDEFSYVLNVNKVDITLQLEEALIK